MRGRRYNVIHHLSIYLFGRSKAVPPGAGRGGVPWDQIVDPDRPVREIQKPGSHKVADRSFARAVQLNAGVPVVPVVDPVRVIEAPLFRSGNAF